MGRALGALSAAILVLSACGGGGSVTAAQTPAAAPATAAPTAAAAAAAGPTAGEVTVQGFKFAPQSLEVKVGTKVTWTNKDGTAHTATSGKPGAKDGTFDGALDPSGGAFSFTFARAGTFDYFCSRHPTSMTGTVVVK